MWALFPCAAARWTGAEYVQACDTKSKESQYTPSLKIEIFTAGGYYPFWPNVSGLLEKGKPWQSMLWAFSVVADKTGCESTQCTTTRSKPSLYTAATAL